MEVQAQTRQAMANPGETEKSSTGKGKRLQTDLVPWEMEIRSLARAGEGTA